MKKKIVIDPFCGAGGASCGIHEAFAKRGDEIRLFAVDHWQSACETHATNYPEDETICQDIMALSPRDVVKGSDPVDFMWASPPCTHFSNARGSREMDDSVRCTPFKVLDWCTELDVKQLIIENVPEFETWGPLDKKTMRPIENQKGMFFLSFIDRLKAIGYDVDWKILNAADYGAPTTRRRLFIQAVKRGSGKQLVWPQPTHAREAEEDLFASSLHPWIPASEIIDWSLPCPLIEERERPLSESTMKRIMSGIKKYWGEGAEPFLVRYNGGENRHHSIHEPVPTLDTSNRYGLVQPLIMEYYGNGQCQPVTKPLGTVTCKDRFALVKPEDYKIGFRMLQPHELAAAQSFPESYVFTGTKAEVVKQIGNAVCPKVAEALAI